VECERKIDTGTVLKEAIGIISESLRQYLSNIPGEHKIKELHNTAI
jgi:hypothetical protein